jgi:hypothetical protein
MQTSYIFGFQLSCFFQTLGPFCITC